MDSLDAKKGRTASDEVCKIPLLLDLYSFLLLSKHHIQIIASAFCINNGIVNVIILSI